MDLNVIGKWSYISEERLWGSTEINIDCGIRAERGMVKKTCIDSFSFHCLALTRAGIQYLQNIQLFIILMFRLIRNLTTLDDKAVHDAFVKW